MYVHLCVLGGGEGHEPVDRGMEARGFCFCLTVWGYVFSPKGSSRVHLNWLPGEPIICLSLPSPSAGIKVAITPGFYVVLET